MPGLSTLEQIAKVAQQGRLSESSVANLHIWLTEPHYAAYVPLIEQHVAEGRWSQLEAVFWTVFDQIKGRMKYLSQSAALATVSVELIPDAAAQPLAPPAWRPGGTLNNAIEALIRSLQGLVDIAIYFGIAVLPILLLIISPFVLLFWLLRRISRNRKARAGVAKAPAAAQAEIDVKKP